MTKRSRTLTIAASVLIVVGALAACSGGKEPLPSSAPSSAPAGGPTTPFTDSARYIAGVPGPNGKTITIGLSVAGDDVAAYACDGTSDEAWFFGTQKDSYFDLTNEFQDHFMASFDHSQAGGTVTLKNVNYEFSAAPVPAPAGMYTAAVGDARASWIVRPDQTITGVLSANAKRDREARQLSQAPPLQWGTWQSTINGTPVVATVVDGNTRF